MRGFIVVVLCLLVHPSATSADVTSVSVTSRTSVAGGRSFGATGPYERLVGRIEFVLDPADPHNSGIVDLILAAFVFAGLPSTAAWAIGLLVGINMVFGGSALIAMALHARKAAS